MTRTYEAKLSLTPFSHYYDEPRITDASIADGPLPGDALWILKNIDGRISYFLDVNMASGGMVKYAWTPPEGADLDAVITWAIRSCIDFRKSYQKAAKKWCDPVLALSDAIKNADRIRKNMKTET